MIATDTELIGSAAQICAIFEAKAARLKRNVNASAKVLFYGVPGVGKSHLALKFARDIAGHELAIEHVNGKDVTIDTVRAWLADLSGGSLFGDWQVKIVDELDRCSRDAQDLLLTYLDRLPPCRAFIGTSNLELDLLQERFQTRLQQFRVEPPSTDEIVALLRSRRIPLNIAQQIAVGSGGNVRAALLDAESYLDAQAALKKGGRK